MSISVPRHVRALKAVMYNAGFQLNPDALRDAFLLLLILDEVAKSNFTSHGKVWVDIDMYGTDYHPVFHLVPDWYNGLASLQYRGLITTRFFREAFGDGDEIDRQMCALTAKGRNRTNPVKVVDRRFVTGE